jgi:hypothetical protein
MSNYNDPLIKYYDRHELFLKANALTKKTSVFGYENAWGCAEKVFAYAQAYVGDVSGKTIVLVDPSEKEIIYLPYRTRFDEDYGKRIARKLKGIGFTEGIFLTLTLNPRLFSTLHEAYVSMISGFNKIITAVRKRYPNFKGYVRVVEFQESGNPHLHVLLFGVDFVPVEWIRELWEERYQLGTQINVKRIDNQKGAIRYIMKYLLKAFKGESSEEVEKANMQKALLWALNSRGWAVSKSLISLISNRLTQTKSSGFWVYLGVYPIDVVGLSYVEFMAYVGNYMGT